MKKMCKYLLIILCLFAITGCGKEKEEPKKENPKENEVVEEKKITIIDEESDARPYAVVINNYPGGIKAQTGLQDAYMIYEIPVEGSLTRSLALYKDKTTNKIGTVRSARHDFLDYVLENDAIFVHFGWSYYAQYDISDLGINNINGLYDSPFWRENPLKLAREHTAYTSLEKCIKFAEKKKYRLTTESDAVLPYTADEIVLDGHENSMVANTIEIPYSSYYKIKFVYDEANKNYKRYVNGVAHTDYFTKEHYTTKNIIVVRMDSRKTDSNYYLELDNLGTGEGYYITNGYAVPITWEKSSRASKTIYKYSDGTEIKVNDGNTYVMMQLLNKKTKIS